jgi:hypothetical protein
MKQQKLNHQDFSDLKIESASGLRNIVGGSDTYVLIGTGTTASGATTKDWRRDSDQKVNCFAADNIHPGDIGTGWH